LPALGGAERTKSWGCSMMHNTTERERKLWQTVRVLGWVVVLVLFVLTVVFCLRLLPVGLKSLSVMHAAWAGDARVAANSAHLPPVPQATNAASVPLPAAKSSSGSAQETSKTDAPAKPDEPKPLSNEENAVANAMTAIGTTVAVITLILSLGVPILYEKIAHADRISNEIRKDHKTQTEQLQADFATHISDISERRALAQLWLTAQMACLRWAFAPRSSSPSKAASMSQELGLYLQALQSDQDVIRRQAFGHLQTPPWNPEKMPPEQFQPLWAYQQACHRYHALRKGIPASEAMNHRGLWCMFWDEAEQKLFDTRPDLDQ
jgi:hypothetical protein